MPKKVGLLLALFITTIVMPPILRAADHAPVHIEIPIFAGGEGVDFFVQAARDFEKARPDIAVDLYGDPRIRDKVLVRILEGSYFEVTNADIDYWSLIKTGDIKPLDDALNGPNWEGDATWRDSFLPGILDKFTYNGHVYGIPFCYFLQGYWYNKAIFRAHGWSPPKTWDEMMDLCAKMKAAGVPPLSFQGRYPYYAYPFVDDAYYHLAGPKRYQEQRDLTPGSFDNPELRQSLTYLQRLGVDYFEKGAMGMSHTESQLEFFLGHVGMIGCGAWLKSEMTGKIPDGFELGFFPLPSAGANEKANPNDVDAFSNYYFVMAKSGHPNEGIDFLRFLTSRKVAGEFARQRDIPTAVRGANEGNLSTDMAELVTTLQNTHNTYGRVDSSSERYPEMEQFWNDNVSQILFNKITPAQAAANLESAAASIRQRAAHPDQITVRHIVKPVIFLACVAAMMMYWLVSMLRRGKGKTADEQAVSLSLGWRNVLLFVGPAAVIYTIFVIVPSLRSFSWSMQDWNGLSSSQATSFVGTLNFRRLLFESDPFWTALSNNLFLMIVVPLIVVPLALFLAACISRGVGGASLFRIVFFFPSLLGAVAVTLLWMQLYNPQGGLVNAVLTHIGLKQFQGFAWLSADHFYWALIPLSVWGACGFNMVLYLAAMENVPASLYEAAEIDGASPLRQFFTITIPMIWDVLTISIVFLIIGGMKAFEIIWLLTNQRPTTDLHVIATRMVQVMFSEFKIGEATAIAVLLFVMVFLGSAISMRAMKRETLEIT